MSGSSTGNGIHIVHLNCLSAYQGWSFHRVVYLTKISNDLHKSCSLMHDPMIHNLIARWLVMQKHTTLGGIVWIFNYNKSPNSILNPIEKAGSWQIANFNYCPCITTEAAFLLTTNELRWHVLYHRWVCWSVDAVSE